MMKSCTHTTHTWLCFPLSKFHNEIIWSQTKTSISLKLKASLQHLLNTSLKIIVTFHQMAHKRNIMIHYEAESLRLVSVECLSLMT